MLNGVKHLIVITAHFVEMFHFVQHDNDCSSIDAATLIFNVMLTEGKHLAE
jgi:hypothetical protein